MNRFKLNRIMLFFSFIVIGVILFNNYDKSPQISITENLSSNNCIPANLPIELNIDLLNEPQSSGDIAFFEIKLKSLIDHDKLKLYFILPDSTILESGSDGWEGKLKLNESKLLECGVKFDTEKDISFRAVVEITKDDTTFQLGKSFHIDLGKKEHANIDQLLVSGFAGGDTLNLIVPASN